MTGLKLGDIAPDFVAETTIGIINFYKYIEGHWVVLFSHPADFTPVCTTELGETAKLKNEFDRRGVKVLALSVDSVDSHLEWINDINETQHTSVIFPIIADTDRRVATLYDMIHPNISDNFTIRSVFIISPDKRVKLMLTYPASTGRNFQEILRVIDSLQLTEKFKVATPANWSEGEDVIVPVSVSDDEADQLFVSGVKKVKPYLRFVNIYK